MNLKRVGDIRSTDLPYIESPFSAVGAVTRALDEPGGRLMHDLEELGGLPGPGFSMNGAAKQRRRLLERVENGELLLVRSSGTPSFPLVEWTGRQWRLKRTHLLAAGHLESRVDELNAKAMGLGDVHRARWPVASIPSAPVPSLPTQRAPEYVRERPETVLPGFHIVRAPAFRDRLKQRLFPGGLTSEKDAMFERLNGHLGQYVLPGEMVVLADPGSEQCTEDEAFLMAEAQRIQSALSGIEGDRRQSIVNHWRAFEDVALGAEGSAESLSSASTALGTVSNAGSRAVREARDTLEEIGTLYDQAMDPHHPMTRERFIALREQRFQRLRTVMRHWVSEPLRLPRYPELKSRIQMEARQQLHSVDTARTGGKFTIPTVSEAIVRVATLDKVMTGASLVGLGFDIAATQTKIEAACTEGSDNECRRVQFTEYGGLGGRAFGGAVGSIAGGSGFGYDSRACLAISAAPPGRIACSIVGVVSGGIAGAEAGDRGGKLFGNGLYTIFYGHPNE